MNPELKLLGLRPVAKVIGFQEPCPVAVQPEWTSRPHDKPRPPGHPRVDDPIRLESGRSVTRTWRLSRLIQPCGPTLLPTLLPACALPPAAKGEPFYPSYEGALALVLSRCIRSAGGLSNAS
jgi:hypothetical protein